MKKFIVALLALVFLMLAACVGSGSAQTEAEPVFEEIIVSGPGDIIRHNETGVCYLYRRTGYAGGMTVMVNPDGSPYVWEED